MEPENSPNHLKLAIISGSAAGSLDSTGSAGGGAGGGGGVSSGKDRLWVSLSDTLSSDKKSSTVRRYDGPTWKLIAPGGIKLTSV